MMHCLGGSLIFLSLLEPLLWNPLRLNAYVFRVSLQLMAGFFDVVVDHDDVKVVCVAVCDSF